MEIKDFCISQGLLWNIQEFFLIFIFRAFSILHFSIYVDNACVAKTTKFSELRKLLPTNDAQGNPTRGTAQARSRGPSPFRGRAHPRSREGPRAAKMGTKICYQGSWASPIASHEWVLKFVIKVVGQDYQDYQVVISWAFLPPPSKVLQIFYGHRVRSLRNQRTYPQAKM